MPDTLSPQFRGRADTPRRLPALLEAVEIDERIVIPGLDALLDAPQDFALTFDASIALSAMLRTHAHRIGVLKQMAAQVIDEKGCRPLDLAEIPASLPVREIEDIAAAPRWATDPHGLAVVRVAFAFVAVHALTDPTDCHTASRALHLRPRPLHDDRALLRKVLSAAMPMLDDRSAGLLSIHLSKASTFFADADHVRRSAPSGVRASEGPSWSLLDYNPDALRESCRAIGLRDVSVRLAARQSR
ncbi:hypothetical protein GIY30_03220 [Gordonia sp. HNM0687]|uniref:Uncharacterized protein n=1 Tax=Gordonia mangrovi TaxID=2665643 RepID=A0A6L7GKD8_9ACTN|nr:hypothetical protein [Gordonia mangrovi]MXP20366.1 hypothetical protein [Gordonia mangrovi]UVF79034.1 hypothetical protein NWF22_04030 [Gordonia mangrovi]